jgi:hypothetical protein
MPNTALEVQKSSPILPVLQVDTILKADISMPSFNFNGALDILKSANSTLTLANRAVKDVIFGFQSGLTTTDFYAWIRSAKGVETAALVIGTLYMTYLNYNPAKIERTLSEAARGVAFSLFKESAKIFKILTFLTTLLRITKNPQKHMVPLVCAVVMIAAGHLIK